MFRPSDDHPEDEGDTNVRETTESNNVETPMASNDSQPEERTPSGKLRNDVDPNTPQVEHVTTSVLPTMQWSPPVSSSSPQSQTMNPAYTDQSVRTQSNSTDGFQDNPPIVPVTAQAVHAPLSPTSYPNGIAPVVISYPPPPPDPIKPTSTNGGITISCTCCKVNIDGVSKRTKILMVLALMLSIAAILVLVVIDNPLNLVKNNNNGPIIECEDECYDEDSDWKCGCLCYDDEDTTECIPQDFEIYDKPIICEPSCFPLGYYEEPCNCLCYQEEIEDLDPECNDDENFWRDFRDDYFLNCEPACYAEDRDPACSCLCYNLFELSTVGKFCLPYDGPHPIYYTYDDDFVQHFYCDPECWTGPKPWNECDCICFDVENRGNCKRPERPNDKVV